MTAPVLIVEDEPMIRMLTADMLESLGYPSLEAGDGAEALAVAAGDQPLSAAVVDMGLPDRPGAEVVAELLRLRPGLPVVVASGSDAGELRRALDEGASLAFLEKPFHTHHLKAALEAVRAGAA